MAALVETALDLSAKSSSGCSSSRRSSVDDASKASPSPVPSLTGSEGLIGRPSSTSSSDSLTGEASFPSPNRGRLSPAKASMASQNQPAASETALGGDTPKSPPSLPSNLRPFKMYPFEPITNIYSQFSPTAQSAGAAAAMFSMTGITGHPTMSSATASPAMSPVAASGGLPSLSPSVFDSPAAMSISTPIAQYLHQRKRRHDSRMNSVGSTASSVEFVSGLDEPISPGSQAKILRASPANFDNGSQSSSDERKDDAYWERRRKNNEAAKRSRDARRAKEEEIAFRAAYLEQENLKLRAQVAILKNETAKLHYMLYNRL